MRILVIGGYGLIGSAIIRALHSHGRMVVGLGRSAIKGRASNPKIDWIEADLRTRTTPKSWDEITNSFDVIINASGVLQNGLGDDVSKIQQTAIIALIKSADNGGTKKFIQISAPDARADSDTQFYRTKAAADNALKASGLDWVIFRPGLVLSPYAYGGTSLLRTLSGFPIIQPLTLADTQIQTVYVEDVANAVCLAIDKNITGEDFDLVSPEPHTLQDVILGFRQWLGFKTPIQIVRLPELVTKITSKFADMSGWLGWRSPLRSAALRVLKANVTGDANSWQERSGQKLLSFEESLSQMPSTIQERIYARAMLLFPGLVIMLGIFWITSGIIGLWQFKQALGVFNPDVPRTFQLMSVIGGSFTDILVGAAIAVRPFTRLACLVSIAVASAYLIGGAMMAPNLWVDPLGPMIKVFPAIALAAIVAALAQER